MIPLHLVQMPIKELEYLWSQILTQGVEKAKGMFHEPRLLKNKGDCTFPRKLYDRLVALTAIEKCCVLSFKDFSTFLSSTGDRS